MDKMREPEGNDGGRSNEERKERVRKSGVPKGVETWTCRKKIIPLYLAMEKAQGSQNHYRKGWQHVVLKS